MATTTEIDAKPTLLPPPKVGESPKTGRGGRRDPPGGRPPKAPAAAEKDERDYQITGDLDFWLKLANFSSDDWSQHVAYLFRTAPIIDRKQGGRPSHLQKYCSPFEREDIMKEHGSGSYRIDLCQINPETGKSFRVAQERFTIVNPKFPPNVPAGDWVDDKSNENWRWGAAAANGTQANGNGAGMYPPGFSMDKIMERDEKMFDRAVLMAKQFAAPAKDDSALTTLVTKLIDISLNRPEPPKPDDTATKALLAFLEKQNDRLADELKELRTAQANPAQSSNILTQVKELRPVLTEFVEIFAAKNGGDQPWWAAPLEKLMEGVGEAIPSVVDMMKAGQQQQQRPAQWQPQLAAAQPIQQPVTAAAQPAQQVPGAQPAPVVDVQPQLTEEQKQYQAATQRWGGFILRIHPQMIEHFKTSNGIAFRDWLLHMHGMLAWTDMCRELGPVYLLAMIAQHPGINADMMPVELREQFVNEFFSEIEDEDEEDGDEPIVIGGDHAA